MYVEPCMSWQASFGAKPVEHVAQEIEKQDDPPQGYPTDEVT